MLVSAVESGGTFDGAKSFEQIVVVGPIEYRNTSSAAATLPFIAFRIIAFISNLICSEWFRSKPLRARSLSQRRDSASPSRRSSRSKTAE